MRLAEISTEKRERGTKTRGMPLNGVSTWCSLGSFEWDLLSRGRGGKWVNTLWVPNPVSKEKEGKGCAPGCLGGGLEGIEEGGRDLLIAGSRDKNISALSC